MESDRRDRLAWLVKTRRNALQLSAQAAAKIAGISRGTWTDLERARRETVSRNWAGIERALRWQPGSVETILAGGDPQLKVPQADGYRDPDTGETYTDTAERDLWDITVLPAAQRRRLIFSLRADRAADRVDRVDRVDREAN